MKNILFLAFIFILILPAYTQEDTALYIFIGHPRSDDRDYQHVLETVEKIDYSNMIRNNSILWFENRWNTRLQTKLYLTYLHEENNTGKIFIYSNFFSPLMVITYRLAERNSGLSKAEIRNDLSMAYYRNNQKQLNPAYNTISNTLALDYYASSVVLLRIRLISAFKNILDSETDYLSTTLELKINLQL